MIPENHLIIKTVSGKPTQNETSDIYENKKGGSIYPEFDT
jgi:hypothetical protein